MAITKWRRLAFWELVRLRKERRGQDLIEYALLLAAVAILVAGVLPANYTSSLSHIWGRVRTVMSTLTGV